MPLSLNFVYKPRYLVRYIYIHPINHRIHQFFCNESQSLPVEWPWKNHSSTIVSHVFPHRFPVVSTSPPGGPRQRLGRSAAADDPRHPAPCWNLQGEKIDDWYCRWFVDDLWMICGCPELMICGYPELMICGCPELMICGSPELLNYLLWRWFIWCWNVVW